VRQRTEEEFLPKITTWSTFGARFTRAAAGSDLASLQTKAIRTATSTCSTAEDLDVGSAPLELGLIAAAQTSRRRAQGHQHVPDADGLAGHQHPAPDQHGGAARIQRGVPGGRADPRSNLVGQENMGWYQLAVALDFERSSIAGSARARRILDEYVRFAHENRWSVDEHPEIRNRLAEISIEIDIAKYLSYRVASMQQSGKIPNYEATIAKMYSSELGQRLSNTGMQLLGLYGRSTRRASTPRSRA
jgi:alkylation response protein AidB-like acyl-CoA dehydrogenase